ncbi:MAG: Asp-tRNA(Asn)/Glu-tRNA(Gln) amidotransferase subunit GatB [Candidatus Komeilibacteria bacterium]|nr:Asp-tRNA(Asn)/Glu-tRNA(Gln) amidotransferase subunit GatB [Candidatus Komeilibacteria bacterium]
MNNFEAIIGLEVHLQLRTKSKLFCGCANDGEDKSPNTTVCPICMGHPGTLPVMNKQAFDWAILMSLALNMEIAEHTKFDRKNYFYPDLPKGYQISQYDEPIGREGHLIITVNGQERQIGIERLHLEEDAAKNIHAADKTLVDYNRSGTPLVEIVSKPDLHTPEEAKLYMQTIRQIARYLDISDADMEKGHLRCDANISLRPSGENKLYPKTEIKNINSFRFVEKALVFEIDRQKQLWLAGEAPAYQSTRGFDAISGETYLQREKEESSDYRYFPEPDLPSFEITSGHIKAIRDQLVELPYEKIKRFQEQFELKVSDTTILVDDKFTADFFEKVISELRAWLESEIGGEHEDIWENNKKKVVKLAANWLINDVFRLLKEQKKDLSDKPITAENLAEFITLVYRNKLNKAAAQRVLAAMITNGSDPTHVMETEDIGVVEAGEELEKYVNLVVEANPEQVELYRAGKEVVLQFLIGQVMKLTKGKADAGEAATAIKSKIDD